jgi:hypothetical protein
VPFDTSDPLQVATLIDAVVARPDLEEAIVAGQYAAYDRLRARNPMATMVSLVQDTIARGPGPRPAVARDFWQQVDLAETLDAIRESRPSAFHALPLPASSSLADVNHAGAPASAAAARRAPEPHR